MIKKIVITGALWAIPVLAFAQELTGVTTLATSIGNLVNILLPIVMGIALLAFFWGLATYIFSAGNPESRAKGTSIMIGGIIALFVMVAIWGIVGFLADSLGVNNATGPVVPTVPGL